MASPTSSACFSAVSLPPRLLRLLPAGAKVAGRVRLPLGDRAFLRRTDRFVLSIFQGDPGQENDAFKPLQFRPSAARLGLIAAA